MDVPKAARQISRSGDRQQIWSAPTKATEGADIARRTLSQSDQPRSRKMYRSCLSVILIVTAVFMHLQSASADGWSHTGFVQQTKYISLMGSTSDGYIDADSDTSGDYVSAVDTIGSVNGYATVHGEYWDTWEYTGATPPQSAYDLEYIAESTTGGMGTTGADTYNIDNTDWFAYSSGNDYDYEYCRQVNEAPRTIVHKRFVAASSSGKNVTGHARSNVAGP